MWKAYYPVLLFLAFSLGACSKHCKECSDDFSVRFNFRNADGDEIFADPGGLVVTDVESNPFTVEWVENDTDSVFLLDLNDTNPELARPDTIVLIYNNNLVDKTAIRYGYQVDNDCCINPRIVENMQAQNLETVKLIKREYDVYSFTVE